MIDRRAFLRRLGFGTVSAAAAVCTFDVEKLLWVPREMIAVPAPPIILDASNEAGLGDFMHALIAEFRAPNPFFDIRDVPTQTIVRIGSQSFAVPIRITGTP